MRIFYKIKNTINDGIQEVIFAWQRVFRGWDDRAVWSIDTYLSKLIPDLIEELKARNIGVPGSMFEGLPENDNHGYSEETLEIASKRWDKELDEIINGFRLYHDDQDVIDDNWKERYEIATKAVNNSFDKLKEYFGDLWW